MPRKISVILPTLNEEKYIERFFKSIHGQLHNAETVVVDGGSRDKTTEIAKRYGARTIIIPNCGEFPSRNIGANLSKGEILVFTCADVVFPANLLDKIYEKFEEDHQIIAISGPGIPYDAPPILKLEYTIYNTLRYIFSRLPRPFKRFITSTNFLSIRKTFFEKTGGFDPTDINADGQMGKKLLEMGKVEFCLDTGVFISPRRATTMGFFGFNVQYLYVMENFFPFLSQTRLLKGFKQRAREMHRRLHL
jgi:glycosyltransferase involved in cell wall biosynthesis